VGQLFCGEARLLPEIVGDTEPVFFAEIGIALQKRMGRSVYIFLTSHSSFSSGHPGYLSDSDGVAFRENMPVVKGALVMREKCRHDTEAEDSADKKILLPIVLLYTSIPITCG
jgi:hypothetical protein